MISIQKKLLIFAFLWIIITGVPHISPDNSCQWCRRRAFLSEVTNVHSPDYGKMNKAWMECMNNYLPYATFDENDPNFKKALEKCKHLEPPSMEFIYPSSLLTKLHNLLSNPCFQIVLKGTPAEYYFTSDFEADIEGETDAEGKKICSRLTIDLYYNGDSEELVKSWTTESPINTISSQYNRMFNNSDAKMRKSIPMERILWDFEKTPVSCQIKPQKIEAEPGERRTITISDFSDERGHDSREFNRILVNVPEGKILNGRESKYGRSWKVFKVEDGSITVQYEAPEACRSVEDEDTIYVFNSCDIFKEKDYSLYLTEFKDEIAKEKIKIKLPEGEYATLGSELIHTSNIVDIGTAWQQTMTLLEQVEVRIHGKLKFDRTRRRSTEGEIQEWYKLMNPQVISYTASYRKILVGSGKAGQWRTTTIGQAPQDITISPGEHRIILFLDKATKQVKRVKLPVFPFQLKWVKSYNHVFKRRGGPTDRESDTLRHSYFFSAGPISDSSWIVKSRGGSRIVSGYDSQKSGNARESTELKYWWKVVAKIKED